MSILVVANLPSSNCERLKNAVMLGATDKSVSNLQVIFKQPLQANSDDVLNCTGIILGTTENFGYMSGQLKDFFERIYYPCLEQTEALPYALYVKGGLDGQGAKTSVERIINGLRWKKIDDAYVIKGAIDDNHINDLQDLGRTMAAGVEMGIL